ncbi:hypothetical protein NO2_1418 [Candidatus Termititenax persephonae]|uniref:PorV/PorQ family protein n=1 Tax=Candidatus Termititenax persephonae TaxID=2218525 RepID=A0A388TIB2_9BACT|nr:hypothetical protein NO2_1418 [Candidatus Termititenax persephonae]
MLYKARRELLLLALLLGLARAGVKEDFFQAGLSAKALALGGTAFGFGVDSLYSNPAGLAVIPGEYCGYTYKNSLEGLLDVMTLEYMRPRGRGAWGIGLIGMHNGGADKTEINEFDRPSVLGKFAERQVGISGAYAWPVWGDSAIGVGARYYHNQLDDGQGQAWGFFAGYIKKLRQDLLYGLSINNLSISGRPVSMPISWSTGHTDYFPLRISNSLAYRHKLLGWQSEFFGDAHLQQVNEEGRLELFYSLGAMVWVVPRIFNARCGLNDETISAGLGLRLWDRLGLDYAYLAHEYLGGSHYVSFSYQLGGSR